MKKRVKAPFFEIGPKSYLYGDKVFSLAMAAERAANRYQVDVLFTAPFTEIRRISEAVNRVIVLAPHMDAIRPDGEWRVFCRKLSKQPELRAYCLTTAKSL